VEEALRTHYKQVLANTFSRIINSHDQIRTAASACGCGCGCGCGCSLQLTRNRRINYQTNLYMGEEMQEVTHPEVEVEVEARHCSLLPL